MALAAAFGLGGAAGCGGEDVRSEAPDRPGSATGSEARSGAPKEPAIASRPAGGAAAAEPLAGEPPRSPVTGGPATDYWYERFHAYMSAEVRKRYLETPPEDRFRAFGELLLEYQRREAALEPYRSRLSPEEIERYRALPDLAASERFLEERFPKDQGKDGAPQPGKP